MGAASISHGSTGDTVVVGRFGIPTLESSERGHLLIKYFNKNKTGRKQKTEFELDTMRLTIMKLHIHLYEVHVYKNDPIA